MERLKLQDDGWLETIKQFRMQFFHAVGSSVALAQWAIVLKQSWLKGSGGAKRLCLDVA